MTQDEFALLAKVLHRRSGLSLNASKIGLLERRLQPVMRRFGFKDVSGLVQELRLGREALAEAMTEAMTVGETSFFRDAAQFNRLAESVLPPLQYARRKEKRLRLWSAGCASGQEAYSLAILLDEMGLAATGWAVDLIATDLSAEAIARAAEGRYADCEVERGLSGERLARHFQKDGNGWQVTEKLRRIVTFRRFNLLDSFGWLDDLDIVFCRNVLIYFDRASKLSVLERIAETLRPDGVLVAGEAEAPRAITDIFVEAPGGTGIYTKDGMPAAVAKSISAVV
jgi:chemotaxis protein methyltransferase CheR